MFTFDSQKNRALFMGILNVTPDSFSDGGDSFSSEDALKNALKMQNDGADIIDIGACSTAPKNKPVPLNEELSRLKKVFPLIPSKLGVPVSVDTFNKEAAVFALQNGASIVNDESGRFDEEMAAAIKKYGAGWIFMHTGGMSSGETAVYTGGVVACVLSFFEEMKNKALSYGIPKECLCYDYGIGFGKTRADDLELLKNTGAFSNYSPLLVGVSRKRVIGETTGVKVPKERVAGSVAAGSIAAFLGAGILRVHDVKETAEAVRMAASIKQGSVYNG